MRVFIVYCHPSEMSFTAKVRRAFCDGLRESGHTYIVSDLYAMGFRTDLSPEEYEREGHYRDDLPVPPDVLAEQEKINACDCIAFVYPVWWADCPAKLKGWFDRVLTVGFAYGTEHNSIQPVRKALFLCAAGHSTEKLEAQGVAQSMRIVSLNDRIHARAEASEMIVLGGQVEHDEAKMQKNLLTAFEAGKNL